jgi:hypothetical protein
MRVKVIGPLVTLRMVGLSGTAKVLEASLSEGPAEAEGTSRGEVTTSPMSSTPSARCA